MTRWPLPGRWRAVDRAREIAREYRAALEQEAPDRCARVDEFAAKTSETWVLPRAARFNDDEFVSPADAAEEVGCSVRSVYNWVAEGTLPNYPEGGKIRVLLAEARRVDADRRAGAE